MKVSLAKINFFQRKLLDKANVERTVCAMTRTRMTSRDLFTRAVTRLVLPAALAVAAPAAHAVDGCKLLLCLAGNWKSISACQPVVRQALRDVARGRVWPTCAMVGGVSASVVTATSSLSGEASATARSSVTASDHQWASAPGNCPEQYVVVEPMETGTVYACRYSGVVNVWVSGQLWSRVWWSMAGETATEYSAEARARLGDDIDPKFDNERLSWQQAQDAAAQAAAAAEAAAPAPAGG